jgi:hypothetical protein
MAQGHARDDGGEFRSRLACPCQALRQKRMNLGRPLDQRDLSAQRRQQEGVPAETCRGIDNAERADAGEAGGPGQGLTAAAAEAQPVADRAADEIDSEFLSGRRAYGVGSLSSSAFSNAAFSLASLLALAFSATLAALALSRSMRSNL